VLLPKHYFRLFEVADVDDYKPPCQARIVKHAVTVTLTVSAPIVAVPDAAPV
jgi:hypothetical protein